MKSESFLIEISLPAVDCGEKLFKKIGKVLPKGSAIRLAPSDTKYADVKLGFAQSRPKEENVITANR